MDSTGKLMGLGCKSRHWLGLEIGENAPLGISILTPKTISPYDNHVEAIHVGVLRPIDREPAKDKIVAVF